MRHDPPSRPATRSLAVTALALCFAGGTPTSGSAQAPTIRDSGGVRIVTTGSRAKAPVTMQLASTPRIDLGGLEENPDNEFKPNQGFLRAVALSDGGFAVIDETRLHIFDKSGKRVRITGRSGAGPEDFRYLTSICRTRGDTLLLNDASNRRTAVVSGEGVVVRTIRQDTLGPPSVSACFDDGTFATVRRLPAAMGSPTTTRVLRMRLDGSVANAIVELPTRPFDMVTMAGLDIVVAGGRLYAGDGFASEVRVWSPTGTLLQVIRTDDRGEAIDDADAERQMKRTIPPNTPSADVAARMDRMRSMPRATTWPTYRSLQVSPGGVIWFMDYDRGMANPAPRWWTAVDANGRIIGRLMFPVPSERRLPMEVISFGKDEVLVRESDDDGAAHLRVYAIVRK